MGDIAEVEEAVTATTEEIDLAVLEGVPLNIEGADLVVEMTASMETQDIRELSSSTETTTKATIETHAEMTLPRRPLPTIPHPPKMKIQFRPHPTSRSHQLRPSES